MSYGTVGGLKSEEEAVSGAKNIASIIDSLELLIKPTKKFRGVIHTFWRF